MTNNIRIVHLTSVHPRYDTRIYVKICNSLKNASYETYLIVADGVGSEIKKEINIIDVGRASGNRLIKTFLRVYRVFRQSLKIKADLYHFHDPELIPVGILLRFMGAKVIYDIHEDVPRQVLRKPWIPTKLKWLTSKLVSLFEYIASKIVTAIVTVTPTIAERFRKSLVVEVRNYVSLDEFSTEPTYKYKNLITYAGGITCDRGIMQMIDAIGLTESSLTLAGNFQDKKVEKVCMQKQAWSKVNYKGWLSREEIKETLDNTLIGLVVLQPTGDYEDAYPVKMFEYMAAGIAVISSNFSLWSDIIDKSNCGICVDPTSPEDIANAINYMVNNREETIEMGKRGRLAVTKYYNWNSQEKKLLELYSTLLK